MLIDFLAVLDTRNQDDLGFFVNFIKNSIIAIAHAVCCIIAQLLVAIGARVGFKCGDRSVNTLKTERSPTSFLRSLAAAPVRLISYNLGFSAIPQLPRKA